MSEPGFLRRHRAVVGAAVVVLAVAGVVAVIVVFSGDDDPSPGRETSPTSVDPDLQGAAADLARLLEAGTNVAFDARYTVSGSGPPGTLRLWSRPPLLRVDTESGAGAQLRRSAQFALPSGPVACLRQAQGPWTCTSQPGLPIQAGLLPEPFVAQLARSSVEARNDRIGDREARCFALTGSAGQGDVCLTPEGIPLRFQALATTVEVVELDRSPPPPEVFEPPAPVS